MSPQHLGNCDDAAEKSWRHVFNCEEVLKTSQQLPDIVAVTLSQEGQEDDAETTLQVSYRSPQVLRLVVAETSQTSSPVR